MRIDYRVYFDGEAASSDELAAIESIVVDQEIDDIEFRSAGPTLLPLLCPSCVFCGSSSTTKGVGVVLPISDAGQETCE